MYVYVVEDQKILPLYHRKINHALFQFRRRILREFWPPGVARQGPDLRGVGTLDQVNIFMFWVGKICGCSPNHWIVCTWTYQNISKSEVFLGLRYFDDFGSLHLWFTTGFLGFPKTSKSRTHWMLNWTEMVKKDPQFWERFTCPWWFSGIEGLGFLDKSRKFR